MPHWTIPHGVDTEIFKPLPEEQIEKIRKKNGYKDKFIIGCVGRNQDRKQHTRLVIAFKRFSEGKEDVMLHFHNDPVDPANIVKGFDGDTYPQLIIAIQMEKAEKNIVFTRGITYADSLPKDKLNELYNIFHIHALATTGEGFGLPIIEANSCGTPNVITNFTSSPELVKGHGELVKVQTCQVGAYGTWRALIDIDDMKNKLEKMYQDWKNDDSKVLKEYGRKAREHALNYDWVKVIVPQWKELFEGE